MLGGIWLLWFGSFVGWMFFGLTIKWFIDIAGLTPELIIAIDDLNDALGSSIQYFVGRVGPTGYTIDPKNYYLSTSG